MVNNHHYRHEQFQSGGVSPSPSSSAAAAGSVSSKRIRDGSSSPITTTPSSSSSATSPIVVASLGKMSDARIGGVPPQTSSMYNHHHYHPNNDDREDEEEDPMDIILRLSRAMDDLYTECDSSGCKDKEEEQEERMRRSFYAFEESVCQLQVVPFPNGDNSTQQERIAFGINLYNLIMRHAALKHRITQSCTTCNADGDHAKDALMDKAKNPCTWPTRLDEVQEYMRTVGYNIGGEFVSMSYLHSNLCGLHDDTCFPPIVCSAINDDKTHHLRDDGHMSQPSSPPQSILSALPASPHSAEARAPSRMHRFIRRYWSLLSCHCYYDESDMVQQQQPSVQPQVPQSLVSTPSILKPRPPTEEMYFQMPVVQSDPRILFATAWRWIGSKSKQPFSTAAAMNTTMYPNRLSGDLNTATELYCRTYVHVSLHPVPTVVLPPLFSWYRADFKYQPEQVLFSILRYLNHEQLSAIATMKERGHFIIRFTNDAEEYMIATSASTVAVSSEQRKGVSHQPQAAGHNQQPRRRRGLLSRFRASFWKSKVNQEGSLVSSATPTSTARTMSNSNNDDKGKPIVEHPSKLGTSKLECPNQYSPRAPENIPSTNNTARKPATQLATIVQDETFDNNLVQQSHRPPTSQPTSKGNVPVHTLTTLDKSISQVIREGQAVVPQLGTNCLWPKMNYTLHTDVDINYKPPKRCLVAPPLLRRNSSKELRDGGNGRRGSFGAGGVVPPLLNRLLCRRPSIGEAKPIQIVEKSERTGTDRTTDDILLPAQEDYQREGLRLPPTAEANRNIMLPANYFIQSKNTPKNHGDVRIRDIPFNGCNNKVTGSTFGPRTAAVTSDAFKCLVRPSQCDNNKNTDKDDEYLFLPQDQQSTCDQSEITYGSEFDDILYGQGALTGPNSSYEDWYNPSTTGTTELLGNPASSNYSA